MDQNNRNPNEPNVPNIPAPPAVPAVVLKTPEGEAAPVVATKREDTRAEINEGQSSVAPRDLRTGDKGKIVVVALEMGHYGQSRKMPGDVFEIEDEEELGDWMKCVDPSKEKAHQQAIVDRRKSQGIRNRGE